MKKDNNNKGITKGNDNNYKAVSKESSLDKGKFIDERNKLIEKIKGIEKIESSKDNGMLELQQEEINDYINLNNLNISEVILYKNGKRVPFNDNLILTRNVKLSKDFITEQISDIQELVELTTFSKSPFEDGIPFDISCTYAKDISLIKKYEIVFKNMLNTPGSNWREIFEKIPKPDRSDFNTKNKFLGDRFFKIMLDNNVLVPSDVEITDYFSNSVFYIDKLKEFYNRLGSNNEVVCIKSSFIYVKKFDDKDNGKYFDIYLISDRYQRDITISKDKIFNGNEQCIKDQNGIDTLIVKSPPNDIEIKDDILNLQRYDKKVKPKVCVEVIKDKNERLTEKLVTNENTAKKITKKSRTKRRSVKVKKTDTNNPNIESGVVKAVKVQQTIESFLSKKKSESKDVVDADIKSGEGIKLKEFEIIYYLNDKRNYGYMYIGEECDLYYYNKETKLFMIYKLKGNLKMFKFKLN